MINKLGILLLAIASVSLLVTIASQSAMATFTLDAADVNVEEAENYTSASGTNQTTAIGTNSTG